MMRLRALGMLPVVVALGALTLPATGAPASTEPHANAQSQSGEQSGPQAAPAGEGLPEWPEPGSARVVPIQETGAPEDRLNLIIMCDGYQADEAEKCQEDVDRNQAVQWSVEPFRSYRDYINVYLVEISSPESGVRRDPEEDATPEEKDAKNTALRLWYADGLENPLARGITYGESLEGPADGSACPGHSSGSANPEYPLEPGILGDQRCTGDQQRAMYLNAYVAPELGLEPGDFSPEGDETSEPQNVQTLAISNTFTYGGIGGRHATASGSNPQSPQISLHELGHSLGTLADEYPYSEREIPGDPHPDSEPESFHHTRMSSEEMTETESKWWRWLGEESTSGGIIRAADDDGYESGSYSASNVWRPSEHSMMRWIGFYFDQVGREHMVARIAGQRDHGQMHLDNTPEGEVPRDSVLWVETMHPTYHELDVTWRLGGPDGEVLEASERNLDLSELDLAEGTVVHVEVRDPVGPDGLDWVRNPSTGNSATDSGFNGPRFVQTREWTVGTEQAETTASAAEFTSSTPTEFPVAQDEVVYVETVHPGDRALDVTWHLDGDELPDSQNARTLDLSTVDMSDPAHELTATVSDPADPDGEPETISWTVDNAAPTAPRELSQPLTTLDGDVEHPVYFDGWDMLLTPEDDQTGYDEERYVVGEFRLNGDGWFNYFGFPEQPMPESPFNFSHSGTDVKAVTYGNLGTGGLSKAAFEQDYGPDDPNGPFVPGFGTHTVEHRGIDPAGNIGDAEEYRATVLPGAKPDCTRTITDDHQGTLQVDDGVTCLDDVEVNGSVVVAEGASLVMSAGSVNGGLKADGAEVVQLFGTEVNGLTRISSTTTGITAAGAQFNGAVVLADNKQVPPHEGAERFSQFDRNYGPVLAGNVVNGLLACNGNSAPAHDFEAENTINGRATRDCADL